MPLTSTLSAPAQESDALVTHHDVEIHLPAMKAGDWVTYDGYNYKVKSTLVRGMDLYLHLHGQDEPVHSEKVQAEKKASRLRMRKLYKRER